MIYDTYRRKPGGWCPAQGCTFYTNGTLCPEHALEREIEIEKAGAESRVRNNAREAREGRT